MKFLAGAIVTATVVSAVLFRYEFSANGSIRNDRWTGAVEVNCGVDGWTTHEECLAIATARLKAR